MAMAGGSGGSCPELMIKLGIGKLKTSRQWSGDVTIVVHYEMNNALLKR
jgi:hypothetical protein